MTTTIILVLCVLELSRRLHRLKRQRRLLVLFLNENVKPFTYVPAGLRKVLDEVEA